MQCTLKGSLDTLEYVRALLKELKLSAKPEEGFEARVLEGLEARITGEFFSEDPLAAAVARGADSYVEQIKPIEEKYGSFWRGIRKPKKDEVFGGLVKRILESMSNVGAEYIREGEAENFTTEGRRRNIREKSIGGLVSGTVIGGLFMGVLIAPKIFGGGDVYVSALENAYMLLGFMALGYITGRIENFRDIRSYLEQLRNAAQKTDEFLRQHYIRMPSLSR